MSLNQSDFTLVIPIKKIRDLALTPVEFSKVKASEIILVYDEAEDSELVPTLDCEGYITFLKAELPNNVGQAIYRGILAAKTEKVIVSMGDGCDSWCDIPIIVDLLEDFDLVNTSRFTNESNYKGGNKVKKWITLLGSYLLSKRWSWSITDPTNNFKGYRREIFSVLGHIDSTTFSFGLEVLIKAHLLDLKIIEIPTQWIDPSKSYQWIKRLKSYLNCFFIKKSHLL